MAEKEKPQEVVEEIQPVAQEQAAIKDSETITDAKIEAPVKEGGDMKMKEKPKRPKQLVNQNEDNDAIKVDLSKKEEVTPVEETEVKDTPVVEQEVKEEEQTSVVEEITNEEVEEQTEELQEQVEEAVQEAQDTSEPLPENIQKVVDFMNETGGSLEEYVRLNQDYSKKDDKSLLKEYYKQTKPHLNDDEIGFLMEDNFEYDEEIDEERDIKRKKLALKEQVASAKSHLDGLKSKYYEEIKAGSRLAPEQKKAIDFFNRYNQEAETTQKVVQEQQTNFLNKTNEVFNDKFKGFEYNIGEKKFRFNVKDSDKVKNDQSDINNFIKKFLDKNENMKDATGYHKSLFTANNPDAVAKHFYEQGKADAIKDSIAKSKNINMDPREAQSNVIPTSGWSVKAVPGDTVSDFKIKIRK
jgi:hypothetical protein